MLSDCNWGHFRRIFCGLVLACQFAVTPVQAQEPVQLWVQSIFGSRHTATHFKPFFDEAFRQIERGYSIYYSNNFELLGRRCLQQHYDVIMGSYSAAMREIERDCGYRLVAITEQPIHLYTLMGQPLTKIGRVGVIPGIRAADMEFHSVVPASATLVPFRNHIAATMALLEGKIDALSSAPVAIQRLSPQLKNKLVIAHTFADIGRGAALLSPRFIATEEGRSFRRFVLSNGEISRRIYIEGMGISPWLEP
ncbi:hypothetical protein [Litorivivens lipolytica]|uniref:hypothetical protein n=1 Tax=Litorivivens lipolytica TaxID=1524264 RepID=UPI00161457BE|nr:hypothetical protein [Litorivivens lipolytica]